jgi:glycine/D-amino acid oxidase-like deaminating enzyme/thioredoxin reductase/Fe-S-cluster-containing hydrogenase component 2/bacterioferritin-associated ferredoxin
MYKINSHPILTVPDNNNETEFLYNGEKIKGTNGLTIAAALHQAGKPVHSHSIDKRNRSLNCGIGKCGACEMLVDGVIKRICITKVDGVKEVKEVPKPYMPQKGDETQKEIKVHKTRVLIVGAGPSGLATREILNKYNIDNIVVDANDRIGGQFIMQTHQFFFFEKELKYGGMRGFDIANLLAGEDHKNIMLNTTVWDILDGNRIGVKNILTSEVSYIDCEYFVVASGALPFMPAFKNDDLPGVYTAAVFQKMMNTQFTLLGKKILTVGAGNIGYLTSYQAMQAGANVVAIIEGMNHEGGFPVQANRVRRLGIPILTSKVLLEAIPNKNKDGIVGAIIADCENFQPIKGTEEEIRDIDVINICTGLIPDNQLLVKGKGLFGEKCFGVGDAVRIGEGTSALLRGQQAAYEILLQMNVNFPYNTYLDVSRDFINSQQKPTKVIDEPFKPNEDRIKLRAFPRLECLYGFACNPCQFNCKYGAITKTSTSSVPMIDYEKCIGCMDCVSHCPGLAIFGYNVTKKQVFLPFEYEIKDNEKEAILVDNNGKEVARGEIIRTKTNERKTSVATIEVKTNIDEDTFLNIKGFILPKNMPKELDLGKKTEKEDYDSKMYICHCEDVKLEDILKQVGDRKIISLDELKHTTRIAMGDCRGKRCIPRVKQILKSYGITVTNDQTPRFPLSNQVSLANVASNDEQKIEILTPKTKQVKVDSFVAGGGMGGSSLFRYLADAGLKPVMINNDRGSSWRCIAGGRPAFSNPELADIGIKNHELFKELQKLSDIGYYPTRYVNMAHDEESYKGLEKAMKWSNAYMVAPKDFQKEISPYFSKENHNYIAAQITKDCWQAIPGLAIDLLRKIGTEKGGQYFEGTKIVQLRKDKNLYYALCEKDGQYTEYVTPIFINALGVGAEKIASQIGIETGFYAVKHQAFITKRLPLLGKDGDILDMIIDRRIYKGFSSIYGQQLHSTGQLIACASPMFDTQVAWKNLKTNDEHFLKVCTEVFIQMFPMLKNVGIQASWAGYYTEPRYIIDTKLGMFTGLRGHGFMFSQYLAKMYVDSITGKKVPDYFYKLAFNGEGIEENALK